jgi:hypothetical protein
LIGLRAAASLATLTLAATLLAGCSRVAERDPWTEAREAARSEVADFWFDDVAGGAEVFRPDRDGRVVRVIRSGTGERITPRSLVRVEVIGVDPADGAVVHRHELLLLVPPFGTLPGYAFASVFGPELSEESRAVLERRGVGTDPAHPPAVVTHWGLAPLPWDGIYRMRAGGEYELPHPTMASLRGLNEPAERPFSLPPRADGTARGEVPIVRLAVLSACAADLRRVEHTDLEWNRDFIAYPRRFRTQTWHEIHGCAR